MKESTLNNSQLLAACEQWANTQETNTTDTNSPNVLFKELVKRCKPLLVLQQTNETNKEHKKCYQLLNEVYTVYWNNEIYIEALHEMFICFIKDCRRNDPLHEQVIYTYENLRHLLRTSAEVFLPNQEQKNTIA